MTSSALHRTRRRWAWWGASLLAAGVVVGLAILLVPGTGPTPIDVWWEEVLSTAPGGVALSVALFMDEAGGGRWATLWVPLAVVAVLLAARRPWGAGYFVVASLAGVAVVQALKTLLGRARPEDILVAADVGSFPSGHVANAATLGLALWIVLPRVWMAALAAAWVVVMAFSRTYVAAHWLTDTAGGALIGAGVALLVAAAFARGLTVERRRGARGTGRRRPRPPAG